MEEANEYICKNWAGEVQKYFSLALLAVAIIYETGTGNFSNL